MINHSTQSFVKPILDFIQLKMVIFYYQIEKMSAKIFGSALLLAMLVTIAEMKIQSLSSFAVDGGLLFRPSVAGTMIVGDVEPTQNGVTDNVAFIDLLTKTTTVINALVLFYDKILTIKTNSFESNKILVVRGDILTIGS